MPRWTTLGLLATVTTAACGGGGAHEAVRSRLGTRTGPVAQVNQHTATVPAGDDTPHLVTITGRSSNSVYSVPGLVPPAGSVPPSGGFTVRAAGAPSGGAPSGVAGSALDGRVATRGLEGAAPSAPRERSGGATPRSIDGLLSTPVGGMSPGHHAVTAAAEPRPSASTWAAPRRAAGSTGGRAGSSAGAVGGASSSLQGAVARAPRAPAARHATSAASASSGGGGAAEAAPMAPSGFGATGGYADSDGAVATATTITVPPGATVAVVPAPPPTTVVVEEQQEPEGGVLTAASVGDADRRANYLDFLARHQNEAETFGLDMTRRVHFQVLDAQNHPVHNATITLAGGNVRTSGRTHADGVWDFFPSVVAPGVAGGFGVHVQVENVGLDTTCEVPAQGDGGNVVVHLPVVVARPAPVLDLGFAIDVTGSMGDELSYVNREVASIVQRVQARAPGVHVRVGATFYRDRYDDFVVQQIPFSTNVFGFASAMHGVTAGGGGDYPEDMNAGIEAAMTRMTWSDGPAVRVLVVIADAPPQFYPTQYNYRQAMLDAARRGIRILPVAASGADRMVEYLFRAMGAFTSTPYVYLTDDSGVGAPHMEADTDRVGVERFNDLLTRVILSDLAGQGMHEPGPLGQQG